ncbi:unnamed protein product [Effrenium voratum]|nr:unnamed protein product [Effrenium voratum]
MTGVASKYFSRRPDEDTMAGVQASWPPVGDPQEVDARNVSHGFVESITELASAHGPGETLVMVSHREGIWEAMQHIGQVLVRLPYCSTTYLRYDHDTQVLSAWNREERRPSIVLDDMKGLRSKDLAGLLSSGKGLVALAGCERKQLWQTPGVRGVWVDNGDLAVGEIVELLSVPLASEGGEGDFVRVRKTNGLEGWTKVNNLRLSEGA